MFRIRTLAVKNFMSVGNATQAVQFDRRDLTLVLGQNLDLGGDDTGARNGTGKTTIINALSYALYGNALTNIKKDNLINKTNGKNMLVTIEFEKDGVDYKIERGRKPNTMAFYIGDREQEITDEACYLSHVRLRTRYGPNSDLFSSGAIAYYDFYGKARAFVFNKTISSDTSNYNLYDDMVANGWNEIFPVIATVTINSGVVVSSTSNSTAAFRVNSLTASSVVTINNNGYIVGRGGRGIGRLNAGDNVGQVTAGTLAAPAFGYGGPALRVDWATNVNNTGVIGGGGGAGGAGGGGGGDCKCDGCGDIGVGGFGISGGAAGYGTAGYGWQGFQSAGQFGFGGRQVTDIHATSEAGGLTNPGGGAGYAPGTSGTLGVNGARGGGGATCGVWYLAPSDPANAGPATQGNANITWINTGTRLGNLD
jgi:hypothetical protein